MEKVISHFYRKKIARPGVPFMNPLAIPKEATLIRQGRMKSAWISEKGIASDRGKGKIFPL
ncbi:MAG: hypothetical protein ACRCXD_11010 [Luteolibacter sp.]